MRISRIGSFCCSLVLAGCFISSSAQTEVTKRDLDGDGVKNKSDKCADTPPGVVVDSKGCPVDTDRDGVADYLDKCPDVQGSVEMNGCQDKDKDGIADNEDICPEVPGLPRFKGCPDSDGDGIEDSKDKCPNQKGMDMFQGCPDTDGDAIEDTKDKCPNTPAGIKVDASGCPADTDKDGIIDSEDKCPDTRPGIKVDVKGCASDTDGDGVIDSEDKCPSTPGEAANNGCPVVVKKEVPPPPVAKRLQFATRTLNFESGIGTLKASSYQMLDEVASIMKEYTDYNLKITGHTDAIEKVGTPKKGVTNFPLSETRVDAIKSYLLGKNVPENRIQTTGYGNTRPVSSNKTIAGRGQNRRAELEFYLK